MELIILMAAGYLLGSIPFGYLVGKLKTVDVTKEGSGNIGATNVSRILGAKFGVLVFVLDLLKGTAAALLALNVLRDPVLVVIVGFCAILGHMYSVFLKFSGGKGSAVGLGVLLGIAPDVFFFSVLIVALIIMTTRYVSVGSILGAPITILLMWMLNKPAPYLWVTVLAFAMIVIKHSTNIRRLIDGTERKIGEKG